MYMYILRKFGEQEVQEKKVFFFFSDHVTLIKVKDQIHRCQNFWLDFTLPVPDLGDNIIKCF